MSGVHQELEYRTIREISARGYSVKEICEILGVSRSGITSGQTEREAIESAKTNSFCGN